MLNKVSKSATRNITSFPGVVAVSFALGASKKYELCTSMLCETKNESTTLPIKLSNDPLPMLFVPSPKIGNI